MYVQFPALEHRSSARASSSQTASASEGRVQLPSSFIASSHSVKLLLSVMLADEHKSTSCGCAWQESGTPITSGVYVQAPTPVHEAATPFSWACEQAAASTAMQASVMVTSPPCRLGSGTRISIAIPFSSASNLSDLVRTVPVRLIAPPNTDGPCTARAEVSTAPNPGASVPEVTVASLVMLEAVVRTSPVSSGKRMTWLRAGSGNSRVIEPTPSGCPALPSASKQREGEAIEAPIATACALDAPSVTLPANTESPAVDSDPSTAN